MLEKPLSPPQESSALQGAMEKPKPTSLYSTDGTRGNPERTREPGVTQQGRAGQGWMPHPGLPVLASDTDQPHCLTCPPPPLSGSGS